MWPALRPLVSPAPQNTRRYQRGKSYLQNDSTGSHTLMNSVANPQTYQDILHLADTQSSANLQIAKLQYEHTMTGPLRDFAMKAIEVRFARDACKCYIPSASLHPYTLVDMNTLANSHDGRPRSHTVKKGDTANPKSQDSRSRSKTINTINQRSLADLD